MPSLWDLLALAREAKARWDATGKDWDREAWRASWQVWITCPGYDVDVRPGEAERCIPTVLAADVREELTLEPTHDINYRGACLGCGWVGDRISDEENDGAEDANDHAFPGWRDLPLVPRAPHHESPGALAKALPKWREKVEPLLPPGWLERGGPIRTGRGKIGLRHVPGGAPGGGYDMGVGTPEPAPRKSDPPSLF